MAKPSTTFNISKGKVNAYFDRVANNDPANSAIEIILLKTAVADNSLVAFETLSALLADAGNEEADFTNYARITLTDAEISGSVVDHVNEECNSFIPDQQILSAGGTTDNALVKIVTCYTPDATVSDDSTRIPCDFYAVSGTTTGNNMNINFDDVEGAHIAQEAP